MLISLQSNSPADGWVHVQADYHQYSLMHKPDRKDVRGMRDKDYGQEGNHVAGTCNGRRIMTGVVASWAPPCKLGFVRDRAGVDVKESG